MSDASRAGFVALIGAPNAGKSTLLNRLVGQKVSIVTHKVQTTRVPVKGITIAGASQIIFIDTPGIFAPTKRLERAMVTAAWGGAGDADVVALLVDSASRPRQVESLKIAKRLAGGGGAPVLLLNKIDLVPRDTLLALIAEFNQVCAFTETFPVSALTGEGVEEFLDYLARNVPEGHWLYPGDQVTDVPLRLLASEVTREKLFLRLHEELPYALTVETENWEERKDGSVRIEQVIYVERDSQKRIVLGKGGSQIKAVSMAARQEMAEILERQVHLFLFVKVRARWTEDPERYRQMGLDFQGRK
ncbi:GTP-binding protein Era [hydrothermal vent metagenome]|uniref:GTP-binding protein Era n=1 Tax=hydrothermal vent metagenome TaxID=652676 RepID=A0A3B0T2M3_9ZZZZ